MVAATARPPRISLQGWIRLAARLCGIALLLLTCVPLYYVWRLAGAERNPWPRLFLAGVGWVAGIRVKIKGQRAGGGAFLLANHVSWMDIPALATASGTAFVAHDGLASVPALRWLCEMNGTVFIARHHRSTVTTQVEQLREAIHDTGALTIFPEGTTSDGTDLLAFKSSLLSAIEPLPAGIAVQPVLLDYGRDATSVAWVGEELGIDNFKRILARRQPVRINVHFLPPLTGEALTNRKTIAATARKEMLRALRANH